MKNCLTWLQFNPLGSLTGNLTAHHQELFHRNPVFSGVSLPECSGRVPLEQRFSTIPLDALGLAQVWPQEFLKSHVNTNIYNNCKEI